MSLALLQGYSSEEEVQETVISDSDAEIDDEAAAAPIDDKSQLQLVEISNQPRGSLLPSAADAFFEISGPPEFLKNSVKDAIPRRPRPNATSTTSNSSARLPRVEEVKTHKTPPAGAILEAKADLLGMHERVRDDIGNTQEETRRAPVAGLPPAEDAAQLLRVCLQCGVPKTYSAAKEGMVCPVCNDRPVVEDSKAGEKKKGSKVKDKERSKRMKGQSTHATWKSETEMMLRQQFD